MRINSKEPFGSNGFFTLKNQDWLDKQRIAGKTVAKCLNHLEQRVKEKTSLTMRQLSLEAEQIILDSKCTATFKGYKGFPEACCISVNKELVHGIPKDYVLKEGDVVSFDLGATYEGAIADAAITCIYGEPKNKKHVELVAATENALMKAINAIAVGKRLGVIGYIISRSAKGDGFNLIEQYGGHGISTDENGNGIPHAQPFVANKAQSNEGVRFYEGMVLAIEPMLIIGDTKTYVTEDNWTVCGMGISAHYEHTVFIHKDQVEIITDRNL
jgi:methionyl aminopeptidase